MSKTATKPQPQTASAKIEQMATLVAAGRMNEAQVKSGLPTLATAILKRARELSDNSKAQPDEFAALDAMLKAAGVPVDAKPAKPAKPEKPAPPLVEAVRTSNQADKYVIAFSLVKPGSKGTVWIDRGIVDKIVDAICDPDGKQSPNNKLLADALGAAQDAHEKGKARFHQCKDKSSDK